jgi:hypothetical protein
VGTAGLSTGTAWTNTSDKRVKKSIKSIKNGLESILALNPVTFKYSKQYREENLIKSNNTYHGFIAQEMSDVFPDFVTNSGKSYGKDEDILQTDVTPILPNLVAAIKELEERIAALGG